MKIKKQNWSIQELIDEKKTINPKPQYQRTDVWTLTRKQKLIDSIIQGFDLPKFYVRYFNNPTDGYKFEVTDGQQRMKAIWDYVNNIYGLGKLTKPNDIYNGMFFKDLPLDKQNEFLDFELTFAEILTATNNEVNELFARLQQGVSLNPAELRNAIPSYFGTTLKSLISHPFFANSKIVDRRFTYQEYLDNAATLLFFNNNKDLKAKAMSELYIELTENDAATQSKVKDLIIKLKSSLDILKKINDLIPGFFKNKWAFVDILNYINQVGAKKINVKNIAAKFKDFELKRRKYISKSANLLDVKDQDFDPELYKYITAFAKDGSLKQNVERRLDVLKIKLA
ncbi:DUF262 domain-containing protein [Pedobacter frigiditerrae]|nr:DUF262 domain-containing protein [Pedobacter frigiditerrae]